MAELWVCHLGVVPYAEALALQERLRDARQAQVIPDVLLLLEHPPVYTRGRRSTAEELPLGEAFYHSQAIEIVDVDRGGRVTYHAPGQLVGYPIVQIDGQILGFLRTMETAIVAALADEGVLARGADDTERPTGVWVAERKIASIGIHVARRVSTHGFAVNVDNDLTPFEWIVPCGLEGVQITSLSRESGRADAMACFRKRIAFEFAQRCGLRQRIVSRAHLDTAVGELVAG
jgi:lipoyl(octanoyl) transferase